MIKIITDSSSMYSIEAAEKAGIESIPLCVSIDDFAGRDLQVNMEDFYQRIYAGGIPKSSQPPIGEVLEAYEKYEDCDIINIAMADGLSGTYQSACSAKEMSKNKDRIVVFNTRTLCGPHRYMVEQAVKMKEEGSSIEEILKWLNYAADRTESFLIPQDFSFLQRGGRLTVMAAALGHVLKLKPVMTLTEDGTRLDKFCIGRTMNSAVKHIIKSLKEHGFGSRHILYISHADAREDAMKVKEMFESTFGELEIYIQELGAAFVTQGGPRCVAIQYIERKN